MKVTDIKTFTVDCFRTNWVFVKVYTDEGIDGVGEATLEYKEKALVGAVEHIKSYLVGKDPRQIEKHFHDIYRDAYWRGGAVLMSALSAAAGLVGILGFFLQFLVQNGCKVQVKELQQEAGGLQLGQGNRGGAGTLGAGSREGARCGNGGFLGHLVAVAVLHGNRVHNC